MNEPRVPYRLQSGLFADLYELTMAQAFHAEGMEAIAVFELFFRNLPANRNYVVAAGLDDALDYLERFRFADEELDYLRQRGTVADGFLERLRQLRFSGDVYAVPEGTVAFGNEPLLQIVAPILEAQVVETFVLNQVNFQTVLATKAVRVVAAAEGRTVVDFGSRRAHGIDAALKAARASYLVGAAGTSNVQAGHLYGIPIFGTMAHSYIQAHDSEPRAFEAFAELYPQTTLLVDTYDTLEGVQRVIELSRQQGGRFSVRAIRLDSGDIAALAKQSRHLLDTAGLPQVRIFASGGLDEFSVAELLAAGAPIDGFGVGTKLAVSEDAPTLDMVYKLVEYAGRPTIKLSAAKVVYPGRKQVFRRIREGCMIQDTVGRHDEAGLGQPLLRPMMKAGRRLPSGQVSLSEAREYCRTQLSQLPVGLRGLTTSDAPYPVEVSEALERDLAELREMREMASTPLAQNGTQRASSEPVPS